MGTRHFCDVCDKLIPHAHSYYTFDTHETTLRTIQNEGSFYTGGILGEKRMYLNIRQELTMVCSRCIKRAVTALFNLSRDENDPTE
jgi:hypothetical protein